MNIYIYKIEGIKPTECLGVLDTYSSFNFTKSFQNCGKFSIKGNFTPQVRKLLKVGNLIFVNPRVSGIIHSISFDTDDKGETTYTCTGIELKGILSYRIVWETYNHDLPQNKWIEGLIEENTKSSRQLFSGFYKPSLKCGNLNKQASYKNLLDIVEDACAAQKTTAGLLLGFDITCDVNKGFTFSLLEGKDRSIETDNPYLVSRDMDNVSTLCYIESNKETVTNVKVGGEGEGPERKFASAGNDSISGLARKEIFKDARNTQSKYTDAQGHEQTIAPEQYIALLQKEAQTLIKDDEITVDAETVVTSDEALGLLGSKITLIDKAYGVRTDDYISEINLLDEADGQLTTLTIGQGIDAKKISMSLGGY